MRLRVSARPEVFFELFQQAAGNLREATELLYDLVLDYREVPTKVHRIEEREHDAEELTRAIIQRINTTFVTPMDREDIYALASALDDVIDRVEHTAALFELHRIEAPLPQSVVQAEILTKAMREVSGIFDRFAAMTPAELEPHHLELGRLEKEGDRAYRAALAGLFSGTADAMVVLKWKDVLEGFEAAIDGLAHVSDLVESVVVKHA